ncbi:MAG: DEAD/DEAH box helicase [Candidatus Nanohaloarchaea archaeon]
MTELLKSDKIESRAYQEVIAASSIGENTLVVLPTGLGKTVIAAMVAADKLQDGKVLFLAPTKPLVEQHVGSFNDFINVERDEMQLMTGKIRPDKRYEHWKEKKVFFATPQVVENDLIANEIPIDDFSLIIFDEAHRATGEYSYVFISSKFNTHKLALTASPGGSKEKIMEVGENLDIENFEVRTEDDPDVEPYIQERDIDWIRVNLDDQFQKAKKHLEDGYRDQLTELKKLGQLDSTSRVHKGDLLKLRGKLGAKLSNSDDPKLYKAISVVATAIKISQALELLETQGVTQCYHYLQKLEKDDSKAAKRALGNVNIKKGRSMVEFLKKKGKEHPKLDRLREILGDMDEDEKAIVFTEYRDSTEQIASELNTEGLEAVKFIGQQGEKGMSQTKQAEVLKAFEEGKYNVIVSTSIGEEGLDIPAVDYVVFYEPVPSGIRDIQRAGRTGRQESGKVYVLIAENTRDEGHYWSAHHKKKNMDKVLNELKGETMERDSQKTLDGFKKEDDEKDQLVIIADDRENSVAKELSKIDVTVRKKRLEVADFLVSERTAVERKAAEDFVDSLVDQRLFSQLPDLQQFDNPIIIIEGKDLYSHRKVHPNAVRGALASIAIDHGIPILWTSDEKETSEILKSLAKREQEEKDQNIAIRGTRTAKTESELQKFVVAGLPDINTKLAERLLERFGSIEKVFTASEEELKEVEGVGDKKAASIRELISSDYSEG